MGWGAFQGCSNLKQVKVPDEMVIDGCAFEKETESVRVLEEV